MSELAPDPEALLAHALEVAKRAGATAADGLVISGRSTSAKVRLGETEKVQQSRDKGLGLRVFVGDRSATTSTSDFTRASLEALIERTVAAARVTAADPFAGLPEEALLAEPPTELDLELFDPGLAALEVGQALELAQRAEAAALAADPRLVNSEGAEVSWGDSAVLFATSQGVTRARRSSSISLWTTPMAEESGEKQRDHWWTHARHLSDLDSPETVGAEAARRTLRRLGARKPKTAKVPVIFESGVASRLLGTLAGAINGGAIYKDASYLCGKLGERVAPAFVTVTDDPHIVRGPGSRAFDSEGIATRPLVVVSDGVLESYVLDTYTGRKLGMSTTRGARRSLTGTPGPGTSNLWMAEGDRSLAELIAEVGAGLFVTDTFGFGVSTVTGDYSQGAVGIWIEDGELTYPVNEFTIAGSLAEMWLAIDGLANDRDPRRGTSAPSLRLREMTVAGS